MARLGKKQKWNAYKNYVKRYREKEASMQRRGMEMDSEMLSMNDYLWYRQNIIEERGLTININQTIVSEQQYAYGQSVARRLKSTAEKFDLDWEDLTITEIRKGDIDLTGINDALKEEHPDWSGRERASYISWEVFGSK